MAKKSKTQRAKASAARAAKREQQATVEGAEVEAKDVAEANAEAEKKPKLKLFKKADKAEDPAEKKQVAKKEEKKPEKTPKKPGFLSEVRAEMKRVTWPTKADVLRWSGVVVVALLFFGIYVSVLDNFIVTPVLVAISGLGV